MIEVRQNADGSIDEVVAQMAYVHLEDMGNGNWHLRVVAYGDHPHELTVNITPKRAFVYEGRNYETKQTEVAPVTEEGGQ